MRSRDLEHDPILSDHALAPARAAGFNGSALHDTCGGTQRCAPSERRLCTHTADPGESYAAHSSRNSDSVAGCNNRNSDNAGSCRHKIRHSYTACHNMQKSRNRDCCNPSRRKDSRNLRRNKASRNPNRKMGSRSRNKASRPLPPRRQASASQGRCPRSPRPGTNRHIRHNNQKKLARSAFAGARCASNS